LSTILTKTCQAIGGTYFASARGQECNHRFVAQCSALFIPLDFTKLRKQFLCLKQCFSNPTVSQLIYMKQNNDRGKGSF